MTLKFEAKEWFVFIISILLLTNLAILLNIPFLRQILGFLFLTLLPGLLIIQILKLNKIGSTEKFVLSVGMSISFLMFLGLFMNTLYPALGISRPLSILPLLVTINIALIVLYALSYKMNRDLPSHTLVNIKEIIAPPALFLLLLPILSILGTFLVKFYGNNILLFALILLISLVVVLATVEIIPKKFYPLAVVMISIALVLQTPLIFSYIGGDVANECYFYSLVKESSHWNPMIGGDLNAMLGITILPTIYSNLLNINEMVLFRILYPLIFSFVPLVLYQAYKKQTDDKTAFLSVFFFMSMNIFFLSLPTLACRQMMAELFLALIILLMTEKMIGRAKRAAFAIIFALSLAVSHYGTSYFYMFYLLAFIPISFVVEKGYISNFWHILRTKIKKAGVALGRQIKYLEADKTITKTSVLIYIVFLLSWYMYIASSSNFNTLVCFSDHVYESIFTDLLNPSAREGAVFTAMGAGPEAENLWHTIFRYIYHTTELFIVVGVLSLIMKRRETNFEYEYIIMAFISGIILAMCIVLPFFSEKMEISRIYHITLLFLAPCCIVGGQNIFKWTSILLKRVSKSKLLRTGKKNQSASAIFLLIVLIPYFLFYSGGVFYFTDDPPPFTPLSLEKYKTHNDFQTRAVYHINNVPKEDFLSVKWLSAHKNNQSAIYTGWASEAYISPYPLTGDVHILERFNQSIGNNAFVYLRSFNIEEKKILTGRTSERGPYDYIYYNMTEVEFSQLSQNKNKVYSNGGSEIYRSLF